MISVKRQEGKKLQYSSYFYTSGFLTVLVQFQFPNSCSEQAFLALMTEQFWVWKNDSSFVDGCLTEEPILNENLEQRV